MTNKVKLNAAEVIKHMSEKELKQYNISLEKEGNTPPSKAPAWFIEFKKENDARWAKQEAINKTIPAWLKEFYKEFKEFKTYVLDVFKRNNLK